MALHGAAVPPPDPANTSILSRPRVDAASVGRLLTAFPGSQSFDIAAYHPSSLAQQPHLAQRYEWFILFLKLIESNLTITAWEKYVLLRSFIWLVSTLSSDFLFVRIWLCMLVWIFFLFFLFWYVKCSSFLLKCSSWEVFHGPCEGTWQWCLEWR